MAVHAPNTGAQTRAPVIPFSIGHIYRACREHGITYTRFGAEAVNDPCLVRDIRAGRELRPATRARVAAYIASLGAH